jgi:hypothetical protein
VGSTTEATYYPAVKALIAAALAVEELPFDVRINTSEKKEEGGINLPDVALRCRRRVPRGLRRGQAPRRRPPEARDLDGEQRPDWPLPRSDPRGADFQHPIVRLGHCQTGMEGYRQSNRRDGEPLSLRELDDLRGIVLRVAAILTLRPQLDAQYERPRRAHGHSKNSA